MMLAAALLPTQISDPLRFFMFANLAVMLTGIAKSGFGSGLGLFAVPLMVAACWVPASQVPDNNVGLALAMLLPALIACDYVAIFVWRWKWDAKILLRMMPGTLFGVVLAWVAFDRLQHVKGGMMLTVGLLAILMAVVQMVRQTGKRIVVPQPLMLRANVYGGLAGFTSMLCHAAGPVVAMFLLPMNLSKEVFVASSALYFFILNQVKLIPMYQLGRLGEVNWLTQLSFLPMVLFGSFLGKYLDTKIPQRVFTQIVYVAVVLSGVVLLWMSRMYA